MDEKRIGIIFLALAFFVILAPACQAADNYATLKSAYITNNPGQSLIPFPWDPSNSLRIIPNNFEVPAAPGNTLSISACPDQTEAATFVLNAQKSLSGIQIRAQDLTSSTGRVIPASAINIRLVKVWYQAANNDNYYVTPGYYLTPELLLKDDSLVKVDYVNKVNYLKVTINGVSQYVDISSPSATFPSNAQISDATTLQSFPLAANENKQVWLTVKVPKNTPAGDYSGPIVVTTPGEKTVQIQFTVKVLPFSLKDPAVENGLYYRGMLPSVASEQAQVGISSIWKTPAQYAIELQDMKDHGVQYPTLNQWSSDTAAWANTFDLALSLRNQVGLPTKNLFALGLATGNPTDSAGLSSLKHSVLQWNAAASKWGYQNVYIGGIDEADSSVLKTESAAWQTVHSTGAKVFAPVSDNTDAVNVVGDTLDLVVLAGKLTPAQAASWHSQGKKIYSYSNPQVGVENSELYRKNYGFALWNAGYDGTLDYSYQDAFGKNIWNDYDTPNPSGIWVARDLVFAYPTSNGVIDTIEWEGWQEGVDDTRYLATLIQQDGNDVSARSIVSAALAGGTTDMATIRGKIIQKISPSVTIPTPTPTPTPTPKVTPTPTPTSAPSSAITVTSPTGGESWTRGTTHTIIWSYSGTCGSTVTINLLKSGTTVGTIATSVPIGSGGTGSYTWLVSSTGLTGSDFKISVQSVDQPSIQDLSNTFAAVSVNGLSIAPATGLKSKIGIYQNNIWYLDTNGNGAWDGSGADNQAVFGISASTPVVGDWNGNGQSKVGMYKDGSWYLDYNGDGHYNPGADKAYSFGSAGNLPVVGDWNGDGITKIGLFNPTTGIWYLDTNGSGVLLPAADTKTFGAPIIGSPVVGDWNGDGRTKIGVTNGVDWYLDTNGDGVWSATQDQHAFFGIAGYKPIVGDWNGDGKTKIAVTNGVNWYLDANGNGVWDGPTLDTHGFFGIAGYTPVVGDWNGDGRTKIGVTNSVQWYLDLNGNGVWDGPQTDSAPFFGIQGYQPVVGKW